MAIANIIVQLRNDSVGAITMGTLTINPSGTVTIWDSVNYTSGTTDNFKEVKSGIATFNQEISSGNLVMVVDSSDQTSTQAFIQYRELDLSFQEEPIKDSWAVLRLEGESAQGLTDIATGQGGDGYRTYEAIVASDGSGDYTSIADAFNDGATSVFVRQGVYTETEDIILSNNSKLEGETGVIINFNGGPYSVIADGYVDGYAETSGTISVTGESTTVTGTGTSFTNLASGDSISIGSVFYEIDSITSDTSLELTQAYEGASSSGNSYFAMPMILVSMSRITVIESSTNGVIFRGVKNSSIREVAVSNCGAGLLIKESGQLSIRGGLLSNNSSDGLILDLCKGIGVLHVDCANNQGHGAYVYDSDAIYLTGDKFANNESDGLSISGQSSDITTSSCNFLKNKNCGASIEDTVFGASISSSLVAENQSSGVLARGENVTIDSCLILNNNSYGIQSGAAATISNNRIIDNINSGIALESGTLGNIINANTISGNGGDGVQVAISTPVELEARHVDSDHIYNASGQLSFTTNSISVTKGALIEVYIRAYPYTVPDEIEFTSSGLGLNLVKEGPSGTQEYAQVWIYRGEVPDNDAGTLTFTADVLTSEFAYSITEWTGQERGDNGGNAYVQNGLTDTSEVTLSALGSPNNRVSFFSVSSASPSPTPTTDAGMTDLDYFASTPYGIYTGYSNDNTPSVTWNSTDFGVLSIAAEIAERTSSVAGESDENIISSNLIESNDGYGVSISSTNVDNIVALNTLSANLMGNIYSPETSTRFDVLPPGEPEQGDILYHDGYNWERLPAGTQDYVLKTNGPGANPEWVSPCPTSHLQPFTYAITDLTNIDVHQDGQVWYLFFIPDVTCNIAHMQCHVAQAASGTIWMGIYNSDGSSLLAEDSTGVSASTTGIKTGTLDSLIQLEAGTAYYLGITVNANGSAFSGKTVSSSSIAPLRSGYASSGSNPSTGLPSSITISNAQTSAVWLAVLS